MSEQSLSEESLFLQALAIDSPAERAAFVAQACGTDDRLRAGVEALLRASAKSGDLLDMPESAVMTIDQPLLERPGTQVGLYKLLQVIGEGGMGVVYMAEQTKPVERRVALKIIKPGMDSRQVIARFEAERQALAMMDHSNIAKVLEAGTTEASRPYFVMELVKGVPITKYCDDHHLTLKERLELFVPVCQAIQHAHQKGIIHRDIKPTNILVAEYDEQPVPKVIDFGVAKAVGLRLTEKTMFTELGQLVGTLEYMSPEQAKLNQLDIDTRSDVYSLGILLYELLTGTTPFDQAQLRTVAFDETLRIIREEEPPKPSTRLSTSDMLPVIAANRSVAASRLSKLIRGELDWIVMKCLEKDRSRRYESANGFAMDIQRYLADEPVLACPPSAMNRLRKFVNRNKGSVVAGLAFTVVTICLLTTGAMWVYQRDSQHRRMEQAVRQDLAAGEAFLQSHDYVAAESKLTIAAERLPQSLRDDDPLRVAVVQAGKDASARLAAQRRFEEFQTLRAGLYVAVYHNAIEPSIDKFPDALKLYGVLDDDHWKERPDFTLLEANVQRELEDNIAEVLFLLAWQLRKEIYAPADVAPALRRSIDVLRRLERIHEPMKAAYLTMAKSWAELGEPSLAKQAEEKAKTLKLNSGLDYFVIAEFHRYAGKHDLAIDMYYGALRHKPNHYLCLIGLGDCLCRANRLEAAEAICSGAIGLNQVGPHAYYLRGQARSFLGKMDLALSDFRKMAELAPNHSWPYVGQGQILLRQGHSAKALQMFDKALAVNKHSFFARLERAKTYQQFGDWKEAIADFTRAIEQMELKAGVDAIRSDGRAKSAWLFNAYAARAQCSSSIGDFGSAEADYSKAIAIAPNNDECYVVRSQARVSLNDFEAALSDCNKALCLNPCSASAYINRAFIRSQQGSWQAAVDDCSQALQLEPRDAQAYYWRGHFYRKVNAFDKAAADLQQAITLAEEDSKAPPELQQAIVAQDNPVVKANASFELARIEQTLGQLKEAMKLCEEARDAFQRLTEEFPSTPNHRAELAKCTDCLAELMLETGQQQRAEELCRKAIALRERLLQDFPGTSSYCSDLAGSLNDLGCVMLRQRRRKEADESFRRALPFAKELTEQFPNRPMYREQLAQIYRNLVLVTSDVPRAIEYLNQAIDLCPEVPNTWVMRASFLLKDGDYRRAVADVDTALAIDLNAVEKNDVYNAACVYSLASIGALKDQTESNREALSCKYAEQAVEALRLSIEKGWNNFEHMRRDTDLDPIRELPAFQELIARLAPPIKETAPDDRSSDK